LKWTLALLCLALAPAQDTGPVLQGKVTDVTGKPVPEVVVSLKATGAAQARLTISGPDGSYRFSALLIGTNYELRANHEGLASTVRTLRVSGPDETVTINLRIGPRIRFEDVTAETGIAFTLQNGATGKHFQPEIMLGGVAAFDFNNDGCMDIFVTNGATLPGLQKFPNRLYRNNCDMTFTDVTAHSGLTGQGYAMGVGTGDYDNDGFTDLLVTGLNGVTLYRNRGDGSFEDVTGHAGLDKPDPTYGHMWSVSAGWFDYDNDGFSDLFITNYVAWKPESDVACSAAGVSFYCHPRVYKGLPNQLFHNNGDGTFTDVSASSGIRAAIGKGMGVAFGDFNDDGLTDIFVANDSVPNFLFQNLGGGKFREVAVPMGVAYAEHGKTVAGMGADFRDIDNDGRDDIALNAMYFDTFPLYRNSGKAAPFADITATSGVSLATRNLTGWGMGIVDFDNDGHKDLFYATSHFPGSAPYVHSADATPNHVLRNLGNGAFEDVSVQAGRDFGAPAMYHGAAFADFDGDGRVDVVVTSVNGPLKVFRNVSPEAGHWLALRGASPGTRVSVTLPNGEKLYNHSTTSVGYASSSEPMVRFGLGPWDFVSEVEVRRPGGKVQRLGRMPADRIIGILH
jgi:hypothetical protein